MLIGMRMSPGIYGFGIHILTKEFGELFTIIIKWLELFDFKYHFFFFLNEIFLFLFNIGMWSIPTLNPIYVLCTRKIQYKIIH